MKPFDTIMKITLRAMLVAVILPMSYANEHPADIAGAELAQAEKKFALAKKRLDSAVAAIAHEPKKKEAVEAIKKTEESWEKLIENLTMLRIAASPAPDTSTSSSLIPYYTATEILDLKTKMYSDLADWIELNWKD